jgi:2-oxoglutarate dehydrogenase E1 component
VGLTDADLDREVLAEGLLPSDRAPLRQVVGALRETYCGSLGVEFLHLQDPEEREWLRSRMEPVRNRPKLSPEEKRRALELLIRSGRFEEFLQRRYPGQTRFSLEGGEGTLILLAEVLRGAAEAGSREAVLAMAHRGRLNTQVNLLGKSLEEAFCEFEASYDPGGAPGSGDVKYHSGYLADVETWGGHRLRVLMPENPSHLEAVNPVAEGIARARQSTGGRKGRLASFPSSSTATRRSRARASCPRP